MQGRPRRQPPPTLGETGVALANAGHDTRRIQDWLGHCSIQHTVRYSELSAAPFKDFWR
jgi:type 1 fimbriae regulatory protein FimB